MDGILCRHSGMRDERNNCMHRRLAHASTVAIKDTLPTVIKFINYMDAPQQSHSLE